MDILHEKNVQVQGRYTWKNEILYLAYSASYIEVHAVAKRLTAEFITSFYRDKDGIQDIYNGWLAIFVDDMENPVKRIELQKEKASYIIYENIEEKEVTVRIMKFSEAAYAKTGIAKLELDGILLKPHKLPDRKIEFIGDSITSGEGLAGVWDENEWITQWFRASKTYAMQVCKSLNADWNIMSQCGWGILWAWNGDRNSALPPHYENVCSIMKGDYENQLGVNEKYDFGSGSDYVVLNLGTNDNNAFTMPAWKDGAGKEYELHVDKNGRAIEADGRIISEAVKAFLKVIRKNNPEAKIIWTWGMMTLKAIPDFIQLGVDEYKAETKDSNVYTLELDSMDLVEKCNEDKGSRGHPGMVTHIAAAKKITQFIQKL